MRLRALALAVALTCLSALAPATAGAAAPAWKLRLEAHPTDFAPGKPGFYLLVATEVGAGTASGPLVLADTVPAGLTPTGVTSNTEDPGAGAFTCSIVAQVATCQSPGPFHPGTTPQMQIRVSAGALPEPSTLADHAEAQSPGALPVAAELTSPVSTSAPAFSVGLDAPTLGEEGAAATAAGSHPYSLAAELAFPTLEPNPDHLSAAGHPRDTVVDLPPGQIVDPAAAPVRCTEAQLLLSVPNPKAGQTQCPLASQVGLFSVSIGLGGPTSDTSPLYEMVTPPGTPAVFGFQAVGVLVHVEGSLRSDSDYGLSGEVDDIIARTFNPILGAGVEFWGDPSAQSHEWVRGECHIFGGTCPVTPRSTALLTLPGDCPGQPTLFRARADTWEQPGLFAEGTYESADLEGNPTSTSGCNQLSYGPTISAQPTTNLADSPSGLDVDLHQPQDADKEHTATAALRDATVTLPQGMVANPSQAGGLEACSEEEIGYLGEGHYSKAPQSCPAASKLGTMEVTSPLLAEYKNEGTELVADPESGEPIPRPLEGSVYLAKPFDNQFGSLLAIYLAIEDPQSGIVAKLAGKVIPDPQSGQLTSVFEENPELPLEDVKLHLFGGARASLITPISCGAHTTTTTLTPWTSPEGLDAHPQDSFQTSAEPGPGSCPSSEAGAENSPAFGAGTIAPQAGAYSPFVLKLSREDGSQRIAGIDTTLPPGLSGKLAGIAQCSEAQIAQAKAREKPNQGILERQSPSCPSSSEVGEVDVSAGAGPTPFHTSGHAYLAGPYKGAPLSLAVIVPAVAGPFDLGAVVSRVALHVDPDTAQIHAVSDPLPQILEGIPLDVRSIAITMGRPQFTLNPTSCDPMSITGSALSALGQSAALSNPFQVGGCSQLPFKPKLSLKLKGGTRRASHPKLIATLKAKPGEANVASAQVKLPPSAFLDQAHIRTVCTRVQFAANACPAGSIYGTATAVTPLLSDPLSGNVYLRSSNHKLPDLVVALKGPSSQPIEIDLDGKTDSVKGALRNTFEAVPDAPVSSFRLELFGGKRGLVVNSRNLCAHPYKAEIDLTGQNGKVYDTGPVVGTGCKDGGGKGKHGHARSR